MRDTFDLGVAWLLAPVQDEVRQLMRGVETRSVLRHLATRTIRLAEQVEELNPGIPVLFTSGYTDGEIERRGLLRPGAAFIQKPLTPRALARAVQKALATASPPPGGSGGAV